MNKIECLFSKNGGVGMYLWNLNIEKFLVQLKNDKAVRNVFPCSFPQTDRLVALYKHYAEEAQAIVDCDPVADDFLPTVKKLLDLDARLNYLLVEMLTASVDDTYSEVMEEFEKYYQSGYLELNLSLPFTKYCLIYSLQII